MWRDRLMERLGFAGPVDLSRRVDPAELPERMDEPANAEELRVCLRDLAAVNRVTLGYRPTLGFLDRAMAVRGAGAVRDAGAGCGAGAVRGAGAAPVEVLDIGFGYGDGLRQVRRWARRRGLAARLTGVELQPWAAGVAAEADRRARVPEGEIAWRTGDVLREGTVSVTPDVVLSSLVMHHLRDAEIAALLRWMERTARVGWFVNDLERAERPYRWFGVLAGVMRWHPYVRHDGPVSFRRAFRVEDWERLLREAGVTEARVFRASPARLCVERIRR